MASYLPNADQFMDLGRSARRSSRASTWTGSGSRGSTDGSHGRLPDRLGPVAQFYQYEVFRKAGLPYEPADVS